MADRLGSFYEGADTYGKRIMVRQSSAAMYPAVWIYGGDDAIHLDVERARAVRDALAVWLADQEPPAGGTPTG